MKAVQFTSKLYLIYVIVLLLYFLFMSSYLLIQSPGLAAFIPWTIQMTVLALIIARHKWVKYGIKGWSLFFIVGSGLILLSQLLFFLSDSEDKVSVDKIISELVQFLLGLILFIFADSSIKEIGKDAQSKQGGEGD